jgi:hypothetical protein
MQIVIWIKTAKAKENKVTLCSMPSSKPPDPQEVFALLEHYSTVN